MPESAATAIRPLTTAAISSARDHLPTVCAIAALAFILVDVLWEAVGHACFALLTISPMGLLSSIGWSSAYDSTAIDAGGAVVALLASGVSLLLLRFLRGSSAQTRLFLLLTGAFGLLAGTGYCVVAALADFGDWYRVVQGLTTWNAARILLTLLAAFAYVAALWIVGRSFSHHLGARRDRMRRLLRLILAAWLSAMLVLCLSALRNPLGKRDILLSDLPVFLASECGIVGILLFLPKSNSSAGVGDCVPRSWPWILTASAVACVFILALGHGIMLSR